MSKKDLEGTLSPASRAVSVSARIAAVSLFGILLISPEHALAKTKTKAPNLFKYSTSGKHISEGLITARTQGPSQQSSKTMQPGSGSRGRR